ncbi:MAG: DnaJ domain-containing protein [bacterium]|nr:DnaJ domain-containing protein [bacterium]
MNINQCYKILNLPQSSSDEEIAHAFKKLALKYHPDKNRERMKWAHEAMVKVNTAYTTVMSYRFQNQQPDADAQNGNEPDINNDIMNDLKRKKERETEDRAREERMAAALKARLEKEREILIDRFISIRETSKDSLYRFFQYSLYKLPVREAASNQGIYNRIVRTLRKSYHSINKLSKQTKDPELLEHFSVFSNMIFNFYRSSECLNIIDSYTNQYDVDAYRQYKMGDDALNTAHKEVFFERHNRGHFKTDISVSYLIQAIDILKKTLTAYPKSTWRIETGIKLEYALALKRYMELFFNED